MTKTQHTSGPWELHTGTDYICISDSKGEDILSDLLWPVYDEKEMANARLMTAAPEILETLETLCDPDWHRVDPVGFAEAQNKARAIVAKAKGEK